MVKNKKLINIEVASMLYKLDYIYPSILIITKQDMLKHILIFLLVFIVNSFTEEQADQVIKRLQSIKRKKNQKSEMSLKICQDKLAQMERQFYQKQRSIKDRLQAKVEQLSKLANLFKQKASSLEKKLKIQTDIVTDILYQKQGLEKKIQDYKQKAKLFVDKIKNLQTFKSEEQKSCRDQIKKIKDQFESRLRDSVGQKCEAVSTQIVRRQQKCQKQLKTFGDKIKDLEYSASSRAKQLADKILTTKNEMVTRIKNYFTAKGPYNREDQEAFGEFKKRVQSLQQKLVECLEQIDRERKQKQKQKQDVDLQQAYYWAQLTGLNEQIRIIEGQAKSMGKFYYIDEIKRLFRQSIKAPEQIISEYKIKQKAAEKEVQQLNRQNTKLKQEISELKQLIGQLYALNKKGS